MPIEVRYFILMIIGHCSPSRSWKVALDKDTISDKLFLPTYSLVKRMPDHGENGIGLAHDALIKVQ
jgi:hypothetical protein